nr:MAG TPA: hypothetical protein [Caudoviricetes sp.]
MVQIQYVPLIKIHQYFFGSYEQAKAFTEVFFIYKLEVK